jgi:hypothetical protein
MGSFASVPSTLRVKPAASWRLVQPRLAAMP